MKIIDCKQGTQEWLNVRLGVATASNFSRIIVAEKKAKKETKEEKKERVKRKEEVEKEYVLSKSLEEYALDLATELLVDEQEEFYQSSHMMRGNEVEFRAREAYQEHYFVLVKEVGFMSCGDYGYSPDGAVGDNGLVEFKCPKQRTHTKYLYENKLPLEYKAQVQGGLLVSGRKWCDFVSYDPRFTNKKLFIKRVYRDEEFIDSLKIGLDKVIEMRDKFLTEIRKI